MPFARMFRVNGTPHNSSIMFNGTLHPFKHNAVIMRHCKSPASHRRRAQIKAPSVFVIRFAVMVFAVVTSYPWAAGTPRPATTTPVISSSSAGVLFTAYNLNRAEATAPLRGSALARIRLSSTFRPAHLAAPLCVGSPASPPHLQRRHTGPPSSFCHLSHQVRLWPVSSLCYGLPVLCLQ